MQPFIATFIETIKHVWCTDISIAYSKSLISSMPKRIAQVTKNKRGPTKYTNFN